MGVFDCLQKRFLLVPASEKTSDEQRLSFELLAQLDKSMDEIDHFAGETDADDLRVPRGGLLRSLEGSSCRAPGSSRPDGGAEHDFSSTSTQHDFAARERERRAVEEHIAKWADYADQVLVYAPRMNLEQALDAMTVFHDNALEDLNTVNALCDAIEQRLREEFLGSVSRYRVPASEDVLNLDCMLTRDATPGLPPALCSPDALVRSWDVLARCVGLTKKVTRSGYVKPGSVQKRLEQTLFDSFFRWLEAACRGGGAGRGEEGDAGVPRPPNEDAHRPRLADEDAGTSVRVLRHKPLAEAICKAFCIVHEYRFRLPPALKSQLHQNLCARVAVLSFHSVQRISLCVKNLPEQKQLFERLQERKYLLLTAEMSLQELFEALSGGTAGRAADVSSTSTTSSSSPSSTNKEESPHHLVDVFALDAELLLAFFARLQVVSLPTLLMNTPSKFDMLRLVRRASVRARIAALLTELSSSAGGQTLWTERLDELEKVVAGGTTSQTTGGGTMLVRSDEDLRRSSRDERRRAARGHEQRSKTAAQIPLPFLEKLCQCCALEGRGSRRARAVDLLDVSRSLAACGYSSGYLNAAIRRMILREQEVVGLVLSTGAGAEREAVGRGYGPAAEDGGVGPARRYPTLARYEQNSI